MKRKTAFFSNSLSVKIPRTIGIVVLVIMLVICVILGLYFRTIVLNMAEREVKYIAAENKKYVDAYLENMKINSNNMVKDVLRYKEFDRKDSEQILKDTLTSILDNEYIFGAYCAFEPDMYYDNTSKGLSYYAYRDNGKVSMDILNDYDTYKSGDYYLTAKQINKTHVTEPYEYNLTNGEKVWLITLSNPIVDEKGNFLGVANCDILAESINSIKFSSGKYETAYSRVITSKGNIIADNIKKDLLGSVIDKTSNDNKDILQSINSKSILTKDGVNIHKNNEDAMVMCMPIESTGTDILWGTTFVVNSSEIFSESKKVTFIVFITTMIGTIVLVVLARYLIKKALKPVGSVMELADKMGKYDLHNMDSDIVVGNDELGELTKVFVGVSENLKVIILDISYVLGEMARGNFCVESSCKDKYIGDFSEILDAINVINSSLSDTLKEINVGAEQVSSGSEQIAKAAQELSVGATDQASSVEELSATIEHIAERVKENAENARDAFELSSIAEQKLDAGNRDLQQLSKAMENIADASNKIGNIISTIDDIASQTNLLSLNAAIEAARAGESGRGFAVVAEEIRKLAAQSAEAVKSTSHLINKSTEAVNEGSDITVKTVDIIEDAILKSKEIVGVVEKIAEASEQQASDIEQVTKGIEQISNVVETNSATAEESAAASEEFSSQAQALNALIDRFKLKES